MTQEFEGVHDLYFWSQNRIGSQLSMLCHCLLRMLPMDHVLLYSILHYAVLTMGYLALRSMLQGQYIRWVTCALWFFPLYHFTDFVTFSYGLYFSALLCAMALWQRYHEGTASTVRKILLPLGVAFLVFQSLWFNEMALIGIFAWLVSFASGWLITRPNRISYKGAWLVLMVSTVIVLYYAFRSWSPNDKNYTAIPDISLFWPSLSTLSQQLLQLLSGAGGEYFSAVFLLPISLAVPISCRAMGKKRLVEVIATDAFVRFLMIHLGLTLLVVCTSQWVTEMMLPRRYFCVFAFEWSLLSALLVKHSAFRFTFRSSALLGLWIVVCAIGSVCTHLWSFPRTLQSRRSIEQSFATLPNGGLIGNYWCTYVIQGLHPHIIATPHDRDDVKNLEQVKKVLANPTIYIAQDMWLNDFPHEITQFNTLLIRSGEPFACGSLTLCAYRKASSFP